MLLALFFSVASLHGRVVFENGPLPGVQVAIVGGSQTAVSDAEGRYQFQSVLAGSYELEFKLEGFSAKRDTVKLHAGSNEVPPEMLTAEVIEQITIACDGEPCNNAPPATKWDMPTCDEYHLDTSLEESLRKGDRSALDLLQLRYETTFTVTEHLRIGGMLLQKATDDSRYWRELSSVAEDAVAYLGDDEETMKKFALHCDADSLDRERYKLDMYQALGIIGEDSRSHALMLRALESSDAVVTSYAIYGLGAQRDFNSLDAVDRALARFHNEPGLAFALAEFDDDRADAIALKYIDESDRASYREARRDAAERHR